MCIEFLIDAQRQVLHIDKSLMVEQLFDSQILIL